MISHPHEHSVHEPASRKEERLHHAIALGRCSRGDTRAPTCMQQAIADRIICRVKWYRSNSMDMMTWPREATTEESPWKQGKQAPSRWKH